ncbi:NADP-dependent oxidoreductase [Nicoliella spurrieriana]|uniref:NADP-dependent oxidoreductase n=1 Tax=Nicoliella spurrieriana TaxID=2925830 RepID=A0A976X6K6_9LACO|nr:NADP-dependent oxidoreductase [Nicoliella spurrieriana]UQS87377.1 NADP-dependent oxidoreductase [Nicoliella spurrieriana]
MNGVISTKAGQLNDLKIEQLRRPEPTANQVLVRVKNSSLNYLDYARFRRAKKPRQRFFNNRFLNRFTNPNLNKILGCDFAGIVEGVGADVQDIQIGDKVFGITDNFQDGAWAEYVCANENNVAFTPSNLNFRDCATLPMAAGTAVTAINGAKVEMNKRILLIGITGGVGLFALQYASSLGANVTGVCSPETINYVQSTYMETLIEAKPNWQKQLKGKFDSVIVINGKRSPSYIRRFLNPNGYYVEVHQSKLDIETNPFGDMMEVGFRWYQGHFEHLFVRPDWLWKVANLAQRGVLHPEIDASFSIRYVQDAIKYAVKNPIDGKIALKMDFDGHYNEER